MNRRNFIGSLAGFAAAMTLDPEKLLWRPEAKTIFIPAPASRSLRYGWTLVQGRFPLSAAHLNPSDIEATLSSDAEELSMIKTPNGLYMFTQIRGDGKTGDLVVWDDHRTVRVATSKEMEDPSRLAGIWI